MGMPSYLTTGVAVPFEEPSPHDFALAFRILGGKKLRPNEEYRAKNPDPILLEAIYRIEHCLQSDVAAARASMIALHPEAIEAMGALLQSQNESVRLGALKLWTAQTLPPQTQIVEHRVNPEDRVLSGAAAASFKQLTDDLGKKLDEIRAARGKITESAHIFRGDAAKPRPDIIERPTADEGEIVP